MIKNLGKLKQWAGEKLGDAKYTLQTNEFSELVKEVEDRRIGYDDVLEAVKTIEEYLTKEKAPSHESKTKSPLFKILGDSLLKYGEKYPKNSALRIALFDVGNMENELAELQLTFAENVAKGYTTTLSKGSEDYKKYDNLKRKLESRRLDYDAKLNRLGKAKKEKPDLEQEMQASKIKYEETEHDLFDQMAQIQMFEREHCDGLYKLLEAQYDYHNQAMKSIEAIRSNWGKKGTFSDPYKNLSESDFFDSAQRVTRKSVEEKREQEEKEVEEHVFTQKPYSSDISRNYSFDSSFYNDGKSLIKVEDNDDDEEHYTYRKALYDFNTSNEDEVGFKSGDIIQVIDEIDKGWWVGEVNSKRGIFPVNYTQPYDDKEKESNQKMKKPETIPIPNKPVSPPLSLISNSIGNSNSNSTSNSKSNSNEVTQSLRNTNHDPKIIITSHNPTDLTCSECKCHQFESNQINPRYCTRCNHEHKKQN